jgi:nitrogen fixation protein FixH
MKLMGSEAKVDQPEKGRRQRQAEAREAAQLEAKQAAERRAARGQVRNSSMKTRVEDAQKVLDRPANLARQTLEQLSPSDLQVYLLAETVGKNRKTVLLGYPAPAESVRTAYELEAGPVSPSAAS